MNRHQTTKFLFIIVIMAFVSLKTYADDKSVPLYYEDPTETSIITPRSGNIHLRVYQNEHTLYIKARSCVAYLTIVDIENNQTVGETTVVDYKEWQLPESLTGQFVVYIYMNNRKMYGFIEL